MENNLDILISDEFRRLVEENLERDPHRIALDRKIPHAAAVASQVKYLRRAEQKLPSYHSARCILPPVAFEQSSSEAAAARKIPGATADPFRSRKITESAPSNVAIDLTCGLGVDSFHLSKRFESVIAIERDAVTAAVARENFRRLGAHNIVVVNTSAEDFLATADLCADLVYADPDRRSAEGKKMVRMEDCSPDITTLLPHIMRVAPLLVVKLSPLFDVDELFRIFCRGFGGNVGGGFGERVGGVFGGNVPQPSVGVEVVSLGGECKEIIAKVCFADLTAETRTAKTRTAETRTAKARTAEATAGAETAGVETTGAETDQTAGAAVAEGMVCRSISAVAIGLGEVEYNPDEDSREPEGTLRAQEFTPELYRWLVVPDVALQKARLARRYLSERGIWTDSDNGYGFSVEQPERGNDGSGIDRSSIDGSGGESDFKNGNESKNGGRLMGRTFEIGSIEPFDPKALKRRLREQNTKSIDILKRNFPLSSAEIARRLGIREGGTTSGGTARPKIAFTRAAGKLWQIYLENR